MKLAIMQPYLFPYLGYFQLIHSADSFVIYDDVNFIKGGWINRNYILVNQERKRITLPLIGASPNKLIKDIDFSPQHKILKTIYHAYSKAPNFKKVYPLIEEIFDFGTGNLSQFLGNQLKVLCSYLGIERRWLVSSEDIDCLDNLKGQERVLFICEKLNATHYVNLPGGKSLYDASEFERNNLWLSIVQTKLVEYPQFEQKFESNLSIIDVLMFNDKTQCQNLIRAYDLVDA